MQFLVPAAPYQTNDPDGMVFRQDRHGQFDFFRAVQEIGTALADQLFPWLVDDPAFPGLQDFPVYMPLLGHIGIHPCRKHPCPGNPVQIFIHHFHIDSGDFRDDSGIRNNSRLDIPKLGLDLSPCFFHREYAPFSFPPLILLCFLKKKKSTDT